MIRITPIGTCRIHTPLGRAVARYPIDVDLGRNYGFVHTSDEVLQQLRFLQGEKQFQPEVIPLVFRPGAEQQVLQETWQPSDLHIVEISSAKRVLCGSDAVQVNYLYRHFGDFFGARERSRQFWNLVRGGHREELRAFLGDQPTFRAMPPADRQLLMNLSTEQQTFKTVKSDMAEIVERLGKDRILFVTHVNALTADGEVIPSRDRLIRWVKLAAEQIGAAVYDPTALMADFGQELALENQGLDLTHYTAAFSDRLYDTIHQEHVAALFGSRAAGSEADLRTRELASLAARIESMIGGSDFLGGSRELHAAIEQHPDYAPLRHLRGIVRSRIGDFRGAMADLSVDSSESGLSPQMQVALVEALDAAGHHREVVEVAERLIREEADNARIYRVAAKGAAELGRNELAATYAKQAYRMDRGDLSTALQALTLLIELENDTDIEEWRGEILENIGDSSSGAFELCHWAVHHRDEELFAAALQLVARSDKWSTIDLMEEALSAQLPKAIATSVLVAAELGRLASGLADRRAAVLTGAIALAQSFAKAGRAAESYQIARSLALVPTSADRQISNARAAGEGRRLIRDLVAEVREAIGRAHAAGDAQAVVDMEAGMGDIVREDARTATIVARAHQSLGRPEAGLDLLKRVHPGASNDAVVQRWTARLAHAVRDYATALEMYGMLRDHGGVEAEKLRPEAVRFFETAEPRSLKQLTLLARAGNYDESLRLAQSITKWIGPRERTDRELARMHKMLAIRLKQIQEGDGELDEREPTLRLMAKMKPEDGSTLRRLALELMRQFRFAEAAECWDRLFSIDPGNESADRNRVRCATLAQRRASASAQVVDIMA